MPALAFDVAIAVVFAGAGWLGVWLSGRFYGTLTPEIDGPPAIGVPAWAFATAAACTGFCVSLHGEGPARIAELAIVVLALTACAATDFRCGMIPDLFSVGAATVVVGFAAMQHDWTPLWGALFAFAPFGATAAFSNGRGMGWGDVKLAALGGALLGLAGFTVAAALAAICAYVVGRSIGRLRSPIAFGPYLAASIGVGLAVGGRF